MIFKGADQDVGNKIRKVHYYREDTEGRSNLDVAIAKEVSKFLKGLKLKSGPLKETPGPSGYSERTYYECLRAELVSRCVVRVVPLDNQTHLMERVIDSAPQVFDKIQEMFNRGGRTADEANVLIETPDGHLI